MPDEMGGLAAPSEPDPWESYAAQVRSRYGRLPTGDVQTTPDPFFPDVARGFPRAMAEGGINALDFLAKTSETPAQYGLPAEDKPSIQPGVDVLRQRAEQLPQSETRAGKVVNAIGEVAANPLNWLGVGPARAAAYNAASGAMGELARQYAEGTPYEKYAKLVGQFTPTAIERGYAFVPQGSAGVIGGRLKQPTIGSIAENDFIGPKPAPFPQYANEYPPVGPPVLKYDKTTGKAYMGKDKTPEALAFEKVRAGIMSDMDKGYSPYFDPAQRQHVDPANYPPNVNTLTVIPKKPATLAADRAEIDTPEGRARLNAAYDLGLTMPNSDRWYAMKQLEDEAIKNFGVVEGRKKFQNNFATAMAATTGGADPQSNLIMAAYGNYLRSRGLPLPEASNQYPFPVGGRFAANNMAQYQKIFDEGGFPSLGTANPKRHEFSQNLTGNPNAGTIDEQMTGIMTPGLQMPEKGKYGLYQQVLNEEAAKRGVPPRDFQDVAWAGGKQMKTPKYTEGYPMIQEVNDAIERTHRLTGMPRRLVARGLLMGDIPIYGLGGAAVMGALAAPDSTSPAPQ